MQQQYKLTLKTRKGYVMVWSHREIGAPASSTVFCLTINNQDDGLAMESTKYPTLAAAHERAKELLGAQPVKELPSGFQYICNNPRTISTELNDCVVRALSLAFNVEYDKVHVLCAKAGRKPRKGMLRAQTDKVIKQLAGDSTAQLDKLPKGKRQTFTTFARENPKGKWVVLKSGHAVAMIDGVYHDNGSAIGLPRSIVQAYYKVA